MSNQQAAGDFPQMATIAYGSSTANLPQQFIWSGDSEPEDEMKQLRSLASRKSLEQFQAFIQPKPTQTIPENMSTRRIVKVFIADPHPDVPMEKALLHQGEEKWTDATDQELFFEIPIKDLLNTHNAERVKWLDKEATKRSGKDVFLEQVKIRDLRMVVVEIAKF